MTTLALDQAWLQNWAASGVAFPINQRLSVTLPQGQSLIYYESPVAVPTGEVTLRLVDADGERVALTTPAHDNNYRLLFTGWSGRALWQVNLPRAGVYSLIVFNHNYASDDEIPPDDRVVFLKQPDALAEVRFFRTIIQVTGATTTMTALMVCYVLHGLALQKRTGRKTPAAPR